MTSNAGVPCRPCIRAVDVGDAAELAALYVSNREFLRPFEPTREERFYTVAGQRERAAQAAEGRRAGTLLRFVALDDVGAIAGVVSLENVIRGAAQSATVGYWVDERRNGRGLATHAVAAVLEVAFAELRLHRVQAPTLVENTASQRVLAKNGFERIGLAREYLYVGGRWRDHLLFQRLKE